MEKRLPPIELEEKGHFYLTLFISQRLKLSGIKRICHLVAALSADKGGHERSSILGDVSVAADRTETMPTL